MKQRLSFVLIAVFLTMSSLSFGQRYWKATVPGLWSDPNNWSGGVLPGTTEQVIFDGASGAQGTCQVDANVTVGSITINGYTGTINLVGGSALNFTSGDGVSILKQERSRVLAPSLSLTIQRVVLHFPVQDSMLP